MKSYLQDSFLYKNNKKRILIVAFSSHDSFRKDNRKFDFYFLMKRSDVDILLVRDLENSWYQEPVKGKTSSSLEMFLYIEELSEKYKKVICLGSSMGGYGALFFGHRIKNAHVLSLGPQIFLEKSSRNKIGDYRNDNDMTRSYNVSQNKEITFLNKLHPICEKVDILYGNNDKKDMILSDIISKNKFYNIHHLEKMGHGFVFVLHMCSALEQVIDNVITDNFFDKALKKSEVFSKSLRDSLEFSAFLDRVDNYFLFYLKVTDNVLYEFDKIFYNIKLVYRSTGENLYEVCGTRVNNKEYDDEAVKIDFSNLPDGMYRMSFDVFYKKVNIIDIGFGHFFINFNKERECVNVLNMTHEKKRYAVKIFPDNIIGFSSWSYRIFRPIVIFLVFMIKKMDNSFTSKWLDFLYRFYF